MNGMCLPWRMFVKLSRPLSLIPPFLELYFLFLPPSMTKHEMVVGVHNIWKATEVQRYRIKRFERGNALCLLQLTTRVTINGHVQRAILPIATEPFPHHRSFLYVAGFGRATTFDFADELHSRPVYVDRRSDGLTVLMAEHNWKFKLEVADQGSAVWNPETGVIFCLVKLPIENKYHPCEELARQRLWIEETRKRLTNFSHYEN